MEITKYSAWSWPIILSAVILLGFAIPGSDLAGPATVLTVLFAILTAAAYVLPAPESPGLPQRPDVKYLLIVLAIFFVAVGLPMAFASLHAVTVRGFSLYDPSAAWLEAIKLGGVMCAFALGLRCSLTDDGARRLFDTLLYAGGLWAVASIIMFLLDPAGIYGAEKFGAGRLTGAFSSPNSAGTLFGALAVMALGRGLNRVLTRREPQVLERIDPLMAGVCIVSIAALMMTVSRGAILTTLICAAGVSIVLLRGHLPPARLAMVGVGAIVVLAAIFATPLTHVVGRFDNIDNDASVRGTIFKSHLDFAMSQPWFGSGLGSFNAVNTSIVTARNYPELSVIRAAHDVYLQWFEETGFFGLAGLGLLNLAILVPMILSAQRRNQMGGRIWAILFGYLVFLLHGFTDYAFQEPALAVFTAVLLGCGFGLSSNYNANSLSAQPSRVTPRVAA